MAKIKLLTSVAGVLGGVDCPAPGTVIEVDDAVAEVWADGERAELVEAPAPKAPAPKKTAKRGTKKVETAAGNSGTEKR